MSTKYRPDDVSTIVEVDSLASPGSHRIYLRMEMSAMLLLRK